MNLVLAMLGVIGGAGVLYVGAGLLISRKKTCPSCRERGLESDMTAGGLYTGADEAGRRYPFSISAYRCTACGAEFRQYNNNGMVPKEAFDKGAREPIPEATVRKDDR